MRLRTPSRRNYGLENHPALRSQDALRQDLYVARGQPQKLLPHAWSAAGSGAVIMGEDEAALLRLWREKRGEAEPVDLSGNLIVQLGAVTEELNRRWYEANTGQVITDVQKHIRHPGLR